MKLDTETALQTFFTNKKAMELKKPHPNRKAFKDAVWERVMNLQKVSRKMRNFHEITTDGVAVSLLYSKEL